MKVLNQIRRANFWTNYWSRLLALALPVLVFLFFDFQTTRLLVAIISAVLLLHAWRMRIRGSQNIWRSLFRTSALLLPMLGAIWLGLHVIRFETYEYAAEYGRHYGDYRQTLYWRVVETQNWLVWAARVDMLVSLLLAAVTVFGRKETTLAAAPQLWAKLQQIQEETQQRLKDILTGP